jgi:hypothetical protein
MKVGTRDPEDIDLQDTRLPVDDGVLATFVKIMGYFMIHNPLMCYDVGLVLTQLQSRSGATLRNAVELTTRLAYSDMGPVLALSLPNPEMLQTIAIGHSNQKPIKPDAIGVHTAKLVSNLLT